jgi:hypothetical protein
MKDKESLVEKIVSGKDWNAFDELVKYPVHSMKFMLALIAGNVISQKALMVNIYDTTRTGIGMYLLSPFTLISNGVTEKLVDFGIMNEGDLSTLDKFEKQALISTLHHTMAPQLYLAGKLSSSLARLGLLGMYWDQGIGFTKLQAMTASSFGDIEKAIGKVDEITKMIGESDLTDEFRRYRQGVELIKNEAQLRTTIAHTFREGKDAGKPMKDIATLLEERLATKGSIPKELTGLIADIRTATSLEGAQGKVIEFVSKGDGSMGTWAKFLEGMKKAWNPLSTKDARIAFFMDDAQRALRSHGEGLGNYIKADWPGARALANVRHGLRTAELMDALEK